MTRLFAGTPFDRPSVCGRCGQLESACTCTSVSPPRRLTPPEKQTARLAVEKRNKGKVVTVIRGLSTNGNDLSGLLGRLKDRCGAGGALDGETLEIQGNHLNRLRVLLGEIGYKVR
jgi:translation initiation factor 1